MKSSERGARPSMRQVAEAAAVSAMTVSRALRNPASVSPKVRAAVQKAVRLLGYRPDPEVGKLMHHLRVRRKPAFQGSLCAITTILPYAPYSNYASGVLGGLQRQAELRGYAFSTLHTQPGEEPSASLERTLRSRGVEGVLLLPMALPTSLAHLMDWNKFSVVATTASVTAPEMHRVLPNHHRNMQLLCSSLRALGYRRIGLIQSAEHLQRVNHAFNAAVAWHGLYFENELVAPLIYEGPVPAKIGEWFRRERPDVIITHSDSLCARFAKMLGLKIPGPVGFATTSAVAVNGCAGIDERTFEIGATAVDLIAGLIQRGEKGIPAVPTITQLPGRWVDGRSCSQQPERKTPARAGRRARARMIFFSP